MIAVGMAGVSSSVVRQVNSNSLLRMPAHLNPDAFLNDLCVDEVVQSWNLCDSILHML